MGDAFGSGGRLHPCFHVKTDTLSLLLDCGPSALIAMKRFGVNPYSIDAIILSHLHGDHFGGIPFLIRETQVLGVRERPLIIAGPTGTRQRIEGVMENFFPNSTKKLLPFPLTYIEFSAFQPLQIGPATVFAHATVHREGTYPHTLRVECNDRTIGYSGDTAWTDALIAASREADLLICEAFTYETTRNGHLSYAMLRDRRNELLCKRVLITHMGREMIDRLPEVDNVIPAEDGMVLSL
ncbi:MAG: MBL fold metallo-hydrolase [Candidatus Atribacteria bacterium]|nr:MAG: MBL fold metallo-hydrolase [Candidatus Atribacteria bacterium]